LRGENELRNAVGLVGTVNEVPSTRLRDLEISSEVSGVAIMIIVFTAVGAIVLGEPTIIARVHAFSSLTIPVLMGPQIFAREDQIEYPVDVITCAASSSSRAPPAAELVALFLAEI